ncbi:hypothetical protein G113_18979 [Aeromonas molluscorum 848]|uniref:Uncharacterized protein n=1 Tax=Aeromonas molluscorum 848 TaxID=1268236 RepID=R1GYT9_9GAMM|nr:hypothetical protein G113_18979 [Aeromonas molluscorum 848]
MGSIKGAAQHGQCHRANQNQRLYEQIPVLPSGAGSRQRHLLADVRAVILSQKEQLLAQGFEVVGDYIEAGDDQEALEKFRSGMIEPLAEFTKATEEGGLYYLITGLWEALNKRIKGTTSH